MGALQVVLFCKESPLPTIASCTVVHMLVMDLATKSAVIDMTEIKQAVEELLKWMRNLLLEDLERTCLDERLDDVVVIDDMNGLQKWRYEFYLA